MKESFFICDKTFYKQLDGVTMGSPLARTLADSFLCYYEKRWLDKCPYFCTFQKGRTPYYF